MDKSTSARAEREERPTGAQADEPQAKKTGWSAGRASLAGALRRLSRKTGASEPVQRQAALGAKEAIVQAGRIEQQSPDTARARLFELARTKVGWPEIRVFIKSRPEAAGWRGGEWNETLLHWAAISDLGATGDLVNLGADLNAADSQGRRPIEWSVERLYFTKQSERELGLEAKAMRELREIMEGTARVLANSGADLAYVLEPKEGYGLMDLALRAGAAQAAEGLLAAGQSERIGREKGLFARWLLAWMAGSFDGERDRKWALDALRQWGGDWDEPHANGLSALRNGMVAWLDGELKNPDGLRMLREAGADPEREGPDGSSLWEDVAAWSREHGASAVETGTRARRALGMDDEGG
jgi:hypothetical protein